jgi:hypothetical protein
MESESPSLQPVRVGALKSVAQLYELSRRISQLNGFIGAKNCVWFILLLSITATPVARKKM